MNRSKKNDTKQQLLYTPVVPDLLSLTQAYLRWGFLQAQFWDVRSNPRSCCVRWRLLDWLCGSNAQSYCVRRWDPSRTYKMLLMKGEWISWRSCSLPCEGADAGRSGEWVGGGWGARLGSQGLCLAGVREFCGGRSKSTGRSWSCLQQRAPSLWGQPEPCEWCQRGRSPGRPPAAAVVSTSRSQTLPASPWTMTPGCSLHTHRR